MYPVNKHIGILFSFELQNLNLKIKTEQSINCSMIFYLVVDQKRNQNPQNQKYWKDQLEALDGQGVMVLYLLKIGHYGSFDSYSCAYFLFLPLCDYILNRYFLLQSNSLWNMTNLRRSSWLEIWRKLWNGKILLTAGGRSAFSFIHYPTQPLTILTLSLGTKIIDLVSKVAFFFCVGVISANDSSWEGKSGVSLGGGGMVGSVGNGGGTYDNVICGRAQ